MTDDEEALKAALNRHAKALDTALANGSPDPDLVRILSDFLADMKTQEEGTEK